MQDGFANLEEIQKFTGVPYGLSELQSDYQLYEARVQLTGNAAGEAMLDQASNDINQLDFTGAQKIIDQAVPEPAIAPLLAVMAMMMPRRRAEPTG